MSMAFELRSRVGVLLGTPITTWRQAAGGYTPAERWLIELEDGGTAFVKAAVDDLTAGWLRTEHAVYEELRAPYMPHLLGWEDGDRPILVLEDLSGMSWPPPWDHRRVRAVLSTLEALARTQPPAWLPRVEDDQSLQRGWGAVAVDPAPFLSLGLADARWLSDALPKLIGAADACELRGDRLLHLDVRSDNLCFRGDAALFVDWNHASIGNARFDLACWLPSLAHEGGPQPDQLLRDAAPEAALISGYLAARAGLPPLPTAPRVRTLQLDLLRHALPWACRAISIPPPD